MSLLLLSLTILALPLARGAVDPLTQALALTVLGAAALLAAWSAREVPWTAAALVGVVVVIALQLVPVGPALHALSPATASILRASLGPLGRYPAARAFSLDLPGTACELAKAVACLCAFGVASSVALTHRRRDALIGAIALSAAAVSITVLGCALVGWQPVLAPRFPFVNPNHLAGFLSLTGFVALGLAARTHGQARVVWALAFVAATAVIFASLSRGGIASWFVGVGIFSVLWFRRRDEAPSPGGRWALVAGTAACALGVAAWLCLGPVERELETLRTATEEAKIAHWSAAVRMIRDFPAFGIGRGAFETVFPAYKTDPVVLTFTHLENQWLQIPIELGMPAGLLLIGTLGMCWFGAARRRDLGASEIGLLAGVGALALHEVFDFSTEVLGVAIPMAAVLGLLTRGQRAIRVPTAGLRVGVVLLVAIGGLGSVLFAFTGADPAPAIGAASADAVVRLAAEATERRPADYLPAFGAGARFAALGRCAEAIPWLERATAFAPDVPGPHLTLARCLAVANQSAARREYRLAALLGAPDALYEAAARWRSLDALYEAVPDTAEGLLALGAWLEAHRPEDARHVYARVLGEYGDPRALVPMARVLLLLNLPVGADEYASTRLSQQPTDEEACLISARALIALGREEEARSRLQAGIDAVPGSPALIGMIAQRLMGSGRYGEARKLAERIAVDSGPGLGEREHLIALALVGQGRLGEAIEHLRAAADATPESPGPLVQLANACEQAGRYEDAIAAIERAAALPGSDAASYTARLNLLRAAAAQREAQHRLNTTLAPESSHLPEAP